MALTLADIARNAATNAIVDQVDGGTVDLVTAADAVLVTFTLGTPAFGASTGGTATAEAIANEIATGTGTATKFNVRTSGAALVFSGVVSVEGDGGDLEMPSNSITTSEPVGVTSLSYTTPVTQA